MITIKKYWKEIGLAILTLLVIILSYMMYDMISQNKSYKSAMSASQSQVMYFKNKAGEEIARREAAEVDKKVLLDFYNKELSGIKDKMDINEKNIRSFITAELKAKYSGKGKVDTVYMAVINGDTVNSKEPMIAVSDSTKWIQIKGVASASKGFLYEIDTYDSVGFVTNLRRPAWYKSKQLFIDGYNANPNSHISGLNNVQVKDFKDKRFGVGPSLQFGIDGNFTFGVSIQYSLLKF